MSVITELHSECLTFKNQTIKAFKTKLSAKLEAEALALQRSAKATDKDNSSVIFLPYHADGRAKICRERKFDLAKEDWKDLVSVEPLGV